LRIGVLEIVGEAADAGDIPVGDYSPNRLSNIGIGHGAINFGLNLPTACAMRFGTAALSSSTITKRHHVRVAPVRMCAKGSGRLLIWINGIVRREYTKKGRRYKSEHFRTSDQRSLQDVGSRTHSQARCDRRPASDPNDGRHSGGQGEAQALA
jgi:hypothetical protein